jgi:dihydrofolate reductase
MSTVMAEMSTSLDGYVADLNDGVDPLHAWYGNGDVETPSGTPGFTFRTSSGSAQVLRDALTSIGALITGRRNFDIAGGWGGQHPLGVPVVVASPNITPQCLNAGLLDEIAVSLVPVLLGSGIPLFANLEHAPMVLEGPRITEGSGVTHLRFTATTDV